MTTPTSESAAVRKPRAAGLSRERILLASLDYLRTHKTEPLSIGRAAAAVGSSPMAIYRHFRDFADLGHAIVERVLQGLDEEIPAQGDWRIKARAWIVGIYRRFRETPQCVTLIGTDKGLSPAWLRVSLTLHRILREGGLSGHKLSQAVFYVATSTGGFARQTAARTLTQQIEQTVASFAELSPEESAELAEFATDVPAIYENALDIMVERMIASVEQLAG